MLLESVKNMATRSMPMPQPAVGGRPYSSEVQKPSSRNMASSSPEALSLALKMKIKTFSFSFKNKSLEFINLFAVNGLREALDLCFRRFVSLYENI